MSTFILVLYLNANLTSFRILATELSAIDCTRAVEFLQKDFKELKFACLTQKFTAI